MPNFFCQIPWENSRFTYLGSVFIFSCLPVHSESVHWFWTILTKGRFMLRLSHAICKADSQHLKGFKICWISLFPFSFYCITISVLLCLLFLGFSYWDLGKPCSILPTYPPRHVEQDLGQIMLWQDNKRGRAHVPLRRENLMHKIKTHKWERDANKTFLFQSLSYFILKHFVKGAASELINIKPSLSGTGVLCKCINWKNKISLFCFYVIWKILSSLKQNHLFL